MIDSSRHKDYFNPHDQRSPITIIGAGATGSRVFEALVNLGLNDITVFDDDRVDDHNLANQIFTRKDVGNYKVEALADWAGEKTGTHGHKNEGMQFPVQKVTGNMKANVRGIVFLLTDTIESRKEIYRNSLRFNPMVEMVIETRMALVHGNVYMFNPNDTRQSTQWLNSLPEDDFQEEAEGETSACGTALTVGTTANIVANLAVNQYIHHIRGDNPDDIIDIYLEPMMINTRNWSESSEEKVA